MMIAKAFKGANVFMSRKLVPPEIFDALRDALNQNGAEVFLCCDPSRSGPDDFHIISSPDHEKFEDLKEKGCNLIGPQCVFSCAKEHRALPKQWFTCCLAMDGVKVLASGFEADEKGKIEKMVTAMGGIFHSKSSSDLSFVIVKNVLAAKYKWAVHVLKKPIVTVDWLNQCWMEHRIVPQELFRVLPFSGLTICVTRVRGDERKDMEKVIIQNGGKYSAELTKNCTHLISDAPEGDKYKVARRWGHIHIVTRKWFDQSVLRRACLNEESYPVRCGSISSSKSIRGSVKMQFSQGKDIGNSQSVPSSMAAETNSQVVSSSGPVDLDVEVTVSQGTSSKFPAAPIYAKEGDNLEHVPQPQCDLTNLDGCVADDSQSEDSDLYLSECRILLVGFEASEKRRLVNMIRKGGGSRFLSSNDKLTHIVVGTPSEIEKKEVRSLAAFGIIHVVRATWLEDCDRGKKEIPVYERHVAQDLLLPKGTLTGITAVNQGRISTVQPSVPFNNQLSGMISTGTGMPLSFEKSREEKLETDVLKVNSMATAAQSSQQSHLTVVSETSKGQAHDKKKAPPSSQQNSSVQNGKLSNVFIGKVFDFSSSFPEDRKGEIVQWIKQGGGEVVDAFLKQSAHFTVECHGVIPKAVYVSQTTHVSSHWIRSCLEDGRMLEVSSHILYPPLSCRIPFPGFENFRFCVSQYEEKDRLLLKNLCFVLGSKLVEKLTKKVTHLLCKYAVGPKYDAACKWGIHSVTSEWIYDCVKQNKLVPLELFSPKLVTAQEQEAGLCTLSQFPTQAAQTISGDIPSQFTSQLENTRTTSSGILDARNSRPRESTNHLNMFSKKARLFADDGKKSLLSTGIHSSVPTCTNSSGDNMAKDPKDMDNVPDVAAAIEDLLEQTSKIHDQKSPGRTGHDETIFSSSCSTIGQDYSDTHSIVGLSKHWLNRTGKKDDFYNSSGNRNTGSYDGFSETQTESQVVGYEEDLSGRQMLIDKVRTRSSIV